MLESIKAWFAGLDLGPIMAHLDNDQLVQYATDPIGIGVAVFLMVFCFFMKWRITFVSIGALIGGIFVVQYTVTETDGPNKTIFLFIAGAVVLAAFIIYFTLMQED